MKMRTKLVAILVIAFMFVCVGCFGDPVKSDLEAYLTFEMSIEKEAQDFSLDMMGSASTATTKEEVLKVITEGNEKLTVYAEKQKNYKPKTKEVQDIHDKNIKVMDVSVNTFSQLIALMNSKNPTKEQLNGVMKNQQEIIKLTKEYRNDLNTLAEQKKVEVKLTSK